jgi:hypothetical protein
MPKPEHASRDRHADNEYSYRRPLNLRELMPAIGIGVAVGVFAFYITRVLLQRTPLKLERQPKVRGRSVERSTGA